MQLITQSTLQSTLVAWHRASVGVVSNSSSTPVTRLSLLLLSGTTSIPSREAKVQGTEFKVHGLLPCHLLTVAGILLSAGVGRPPLVGGRVLIPSSQLLTTSVSYRTTLDRWLGVSCRTEVKCVPTVSSGGGGLVGGGLLVVGLGVLSLGGGLGARVRGVIVRVASCTVILTTISYNTN